MTARRIDGIDGLAACAGEHLGGSDWLEVTRPRAERFATSLGATFDPRSDTAPEFLTLSLTPVLLPQVVDVSGFSTGVNYGCTSVRFLSPVGIGQQIRLGVELLAANPIAGGVEIGYRLTFEIRDVDQPACVADVLFRFYT